MTETYENQVCFCKVNGNILRQGLSDVKPVENGGYALCEAGSIQKTYLDLKGILYNF